MSWRRVSLLLLSILFLRGLLLLCILPPWEGIDEYQHLGYIAFLLQEHRLPVVGEDSVPDSIVREMRDFPVPEHALHHTAAWGTRGYHDFWNGVQASPGDGPALPLYQAQHPPLYYLLMSPVYRWIAPAGILTTVNLLRILNLLFLVLATWIFSLLLEALIACPSVRFWILALSAFFPLFLGNACRVANDPSAIFWSLLSLLFLFRYVSSGSLPAAVWGALCLGLGVWSKNTALAWIPLWLAALAIRFFRDPDPVRRKKTAVATATVFGLWTISCGPLFYWNWLHYGRFGSMVEFTYASFREKSAADLLAVLPEIDWLRDLARFLGRIWIGGWSFLKLPPWVEILYVGTIFLIVVAFLFQWIYRPLRQRDRMPRRSRSGRSIFPSWAEALLTAASVSLVLAGMFYHVWITQATYGVPSTNAWYFMMALPTFFCLLYQMVHFLNPIAAKVYAAIWVFFFFALELWGLFWRMAPLYTDSTWSAETWSRLAALHPWFLGPWLIPPLLVGIAVLSTCLFFAVKKIPNQGL